MLCLKHTLRNPIRETLRKMKSPLFLISINLQYSLRNTEPYEKCMSVGMMYQVCTYFEAR